MKKTSAVIILLCLLAIPPLSGQTVSLKAGLNIAEIYEKTNALVSEYEVLPGPHFGLGIDLPVYRSVFFESGLRIARKGFKITGADYLWIDDNKNYKYSLYYLGIPFMIKKMNKISSNTNQYFLFGAYLGIGLSGKARVETLSSGRDEVEITKIEWGEDLKRGDAGIRIGLGWEFGIFITELSYEFGLKNIVPDTDEYIDDGYKLKNMALSVSVGINFGKRADW